MYSTLRSLRHTLLFTGCLLGALSTSANNISTSTGSLTGNTGTQVFVKFNVTWQNSWRINPDRWDAAWVFVKYRNSNGLWQHARLENTGHVAPSGSTITTGLLAPGSAFNASTNPGVGAFIYRSVDGTGTFTANNIQLLWNYAVDGVIIADVTEVRVYAIEMVYVPQGAFAAGSGGTETSAFTLTTINTANANTAPSGTGSLGGQAGGFPTGQTAPPSSSWPNGFSAFYSMKYEVTQQGYGDFLNTLTYTQQVTRTSAAPNSTAGIGAFGNSNFLRNGLAIQTPGVASTTPAVYACNLNGNTAYGESTDGKDIACSVLSWGDLSAYLDWCGLRPMTELEFEKACRGTVAPVANEYPWGTTSIASTTYFLANAGATDEGIGTGYSSTFGNASYFATTDLSITGPVRVGIFAANGNNNGRATAGASYYGIMELGGNMWERPVTIGNANGRAFTGTHGNGALAATGEPDVVNWPLPTTAVGTGLRGGSLTSGALILRVSDRNSAANAISGRSDTQGGRGVRHAP
ncbi:MAG: SUMF1/EgtB/PvdO family nonheme iron enzyme [Flavobacteriales bacterium]|nr:SUMF1/EgtB/PvdO family nonheme iron enzyme [Flavobacteriales bacterium]